MTGGAQIHDGRLAGLEEGGVAAQVPQARIVELGGGDSIRFHREEERAHHAVPGLLGEFRGDFLAPDLQFRDALHALLLGRTTAGVVDAFQPFELAIGRSERGTDFDEVRR